MKKPKHNFNLESKVRKSGEQLIFFNLNYGYKEFDISTKKYKYIPMRISTQWTIKKEFWNGIPNYRASRKYVSKYGKDINSVLDEIENTSYEQLSFYKNEHDEIPEPKVLKQKILEKLKRIPKISTDIHVTDFITNLIERRTNLPSSSKEFWGEGTKIGYNNTLKHILNYEEFHDIKLSFEQLNEEIYWDFFKTINEIHKTNNGKPYIRTTIAKECKNLRAIFNCANEENITIGFNFSKKGLKIQPSKARHQTYLSEKQLKAIINRDVSHSIELQRAKDYIIISSLTGLRIGDMVHLHEIKTEIITHKAVNFSCFSTKIRKSQENSSELLVTIPILKPVNTILKKYNNNFPKFTSKTNIRQCVKKLLTHLEFEDNVVVSYDYYLSDEVEQINKKLFNVFTPHDCRRTFITNLKQLGIQNDTIEPITHPKVNFKSVLDSYDKSTLKDKALKLTKDLRTKESDVFSI